MITRVLNYGHVLLNYRKLFCVHDISVEPQHLRRSKSSKLLTPRKSPATKQDHASKQAKTLNPQSIKNTAFVTMKLNRNFLTRYIQKKIEKRKDQRPRALQKKQTNKFFYLINIIISNQLLIGVMKNKTIELTKEILT